MATASPSFANTLQGLRRSPRTSKELKTHSDVTQNRPDFETQGAVKASRLKRRRSGFDFSQSEQPSKRGKRLYRTTEQYEEALLFGDERIRSLEEEKKALKNEIEGLKKQLSKEFACPICEKSYNRSDGLYNHLQKGDEKHRRLAQERYDNTKCEICGRECARWGDLKKHMAVHGQKGSVAELNVELDATVSPPPRLCVVASTAQETAPTTTQLAVTKNPILEVAWPLNTSPHLNSEDSVQSTIQSRNQAANCPPSMPCLKQALGFSKSPARGLDFATPSYMNAMPSSAKVDTVQAPGFSNSPARGLDFTPLDYIHPSPYSDSAITVQTRGFSNNPDPGMDIAPPGYIHSSPYSDNPVTVQAPGFSNSPARGLDFTPPDYAHSSVYNNNPISVQAPGFSNSPARGLDFTPHDYAHSSLYDSDTVSVQAPGFSNSPARGLDFTPHNYAHSSLYNSDTVSVQAPGFLNSPARGLGFSPPSHIHSLIYGDNTSTVQAPGFSNSPACGLNSTPPAYTYPSLYSNDPVTVQAPGFSNSPARGLDFTHSGYTHPPHSNDTLQTPGFSNSTARRSDLAPSNNIRPSLYNIVTQEASSLWSRPVTEQDLDFLDNSGGRRDYTSIRGAQSPSIIACQGTMQSMGNMQLVQMF